MKFRNQIDLELKEIAPKEEILQTILADKGAPRPLQKCGIFLFAALCGLLLFIPVSAKIRNTIHETTRITEENRDLIDQISIASSEMYPADDPCIPKNESPADGPDIAKTGSPAIGAEITTPGAPANDPESISGETDGIIREIEAGALLPNTVTVISLAPSSEENAWEIPELLTENGFCTIFTKEDGEGWELKAGEALRIQYSIGATADTNPDSPQERMLIGYIGNHVFREGVLCQAQEFEYTLYAPEDGIYYLYNVNVSAGRILITEGEIR